MSRCVGLALAWILLGAGFDALAAPAPTPPVTAQAPTDPWVLALREEVERLRADAAKAEAAAPDEASRTRTRLELLTQLLLLTIRQQEQLYLQNKELLALSGQTGSAAAAPAARTPGATSSTPPRPAPAVVANRASGPGPVFAKRAGGGKAHRAGCVFGERILPATRVIFATATQAAAAGFPPCKVCRPGN